MTIVKNSLHVGSYTITVNFLRCYIVLPEFLMMSEMGINVTTDPSLKQLLTSYSPQSDLVSNTQIYGCCRHTQGTKLR